MHPFQFPSVKKRSILKGLIVFSVVIVSMAFSWPSEDSDTRAALSKNILPKSNVFNPVSDTVTKTFAVSGKGRCKSTIEGLVSSQSGVLSVSWDSTAQMITITYNHTIIHKRQLCSILAQAGYDNAFTHAKDSAYNALSPACQYPRPTRSATGSIN